MAGEIYIDIDLDFNLAYAPPVIELTQYSETLPVVRAHLYSGGTAYTVPDGAAVNLREHKPTGTGVYAPASASGSVITFPLTSSCLSAYGDCESCFEISNVNGTLQTPKFILRVAKNPVQQDDVLDTDDFETLVGYRNSAQEAAKAAEASQKAAAASEANASDSQKAAATSEANAATSESNAKNSETNAAASEATAKQYSGKPPKPVNGTWWTWDAAAQAYTDTGAPSVLAISKSYATIAAMQADFDNMAVNDLVIIATDDIAEADNSKLYIRTDTEWQYLSDLSGISGVGISGIERTGGDGSAGTTDTYTITLTNGSTYDFTVHNGSDNAEAVAKLQTDKVNKGGDTMSGDLSISASLTAARVNAGSAASLYSNNEGGNLRIIDSDSSNESEIDGYLSSQIRWYRQRLNPADGESHYQQVALCDDGFSVSGKIISDSGFQLRETGALSYNGLIINFFRYGNMVQINVDCKITDSIPIGTIVGTISQSFTPANYACICIGVNSTRIGYLVINSASSVIWYFAPLSKDDYAEGGGVYFI